MASVKSVVLMALLVGQASSGCGGSQTGSNKASNDQSPPVVVVDGKDLNFGGGVTSSSSTCQEDPTGNHANMSRVVAWRGVTSTQPETVMLSFPKQDTGLGPLLLVELPNGQRYNSNLKTTQIAVDGPTDGWYKFSGMVHRASSGDPDFLTTLSVKGSIACANYGASVLPS
ncbi:MAG: hypothetical protein QOH57_1036 [Mycobacterium sp.]|nr:hypothetical protein [Mycobacterium sp.]